MDRLDDLGLNAREVAGLRRDGRLESLLRVISGGDPPGELPFDQDIVDAASLWQRGCAELAAGEAGPARVLFARALGNAPHAPMFGLSVVLAEAARENWVAVDEGLVEWAPHWYGDPRFEATLGMLGLARGDLEEAAEGLSPAALDRRSPVHALAAERYFFVLLVRGRFHEAEQFAHRMARSGGGGAWSERRADAMVFAGDYEAARVAYLALEEHHRAATRTLLKLSDVHFALGDLEGERLYRERVFGTLFSGD